MKLFKQIIELAADPNALVLVLIDEVESLTAARTASLAGTDPSDSIRVVNGAYYLHRIGSTVERARFPVHMKWKPGTDSPANSPAISTH